MVGAKVIGSPLRAVLSPLSALGLALVGACSSPAPEPISVDEESVTWDATDFCRETTCAPPSDYPKGDRCAPAGWASTCADQGKWDVPLWWRTGCVGWSVQKDASSRVTFAEAETAARAAFAAWTTAPCDGGPPSIGAVEDAPVACNRAEHDDHGPNQNAIIFQDRAWPHDDPRRTIALTTTWFDSRTGEILDGDIEVNEAFFEVGVHGERYDLQAVLVHETGHFLGLAHSSSTSSVMYPSDEGTKDVISKADAEGICAIYPPGGARRVSTVVDPSGTMAAGACDGTPVGGFTSACE